MELENCADGDFCSLCLDKFSDRSLERPSIDKRITLICGEGTKNVTTNRRTKRLIKRVKRRTGLQIKNKK